DSIQIIQQPESLSLSKGSTAQLKLTTNTDGDFQWYFNGYELSDNDRIQGSSTSTLTITGIDSTDIGNYRCYAEGYCNQIYSDLVSLDIITSTDDLNKNQPVIYPNPVNNILYVTNQKEILQISIINTKGESILKLIPNDINENAINVSHFQQGLYFIKILTKNGIITGKFVK
ncbi:MAG TPA: T9SS type A sorting domain-containing protein, partial [Bacteroidetes bacterium]|nr:T9SS type A sorting domain-containing protein [Bacteroidota bacterium]